MLKSKLINLEYDNSEMRSQSEPPYKRDIRTKTRVTYLCYLVPRVVANTRLNKTAVRTNGWNGAEELI